MRWWPRRGAGPNTGRIDQSGTAGITLANTGEIGSITIGPATYLLEHFPLAPTDHPDPKALAPSRLLAARHQLVRFTGRDDELRWLAGWRDGPAGVVVRLVHASGGQGKTRLAAKFAAASAAEGWLVWQARHRPAAATPSATDGQRETAAAGRGVLLVVDYAERWPPGHLVQVLGDGALRGHGPVRVLLLGRPAGLWWTALRHELDKVDAAADEMPLAPLAPTREDRVAVFTAARNRFAELLTVVDPGGIAPPVDLDEDDYARVLTAHMAALVAVDAAGSGRRAPADAVGLSSYLLDREHAYWQHLHTHRAEHTTPPLVMSRAVFLATLARPLPRERAVGVLRHVELASSAETCGQTIDDHAACYPPADTDTVFEPLYPDRLGEDFLALQLPGHTVASYNPDGWTANALSRMLAAAEGQGTEAAPQHIRNAVTVLIEAARRWPHLAAGHLYPLLRARPELAIATGGAALTVLAAFNDIDMTVLEAIEPLLPDGRHVDLDIGAAAITHRLTERRLTDTSDPARRAALHATLGWRLGNAGLHQQALAPTEEATGIYRGLVEVNPAAYLPDLALSLNNLGIWLSELGRREEALAPAEEATGIYRGLVEVNPAAYLPDLARSLNNLGAMLSGLGRREEALAPTEEAVTIRRRLVEVNPAPYLPDLARGLGGFAWVRATVGLELADALTAVQEAIVIYQRLAEEIPDAFGGDLLSARYTLADILDGLGRHDEAAELRRQIGGDAAPDDG